MGHKLQKNNNIEITRQIEIQEEEAKPRQSRYAEEYKLIAPQYTEKQVNLTEQNNKRNELETRARFRLGTEAKANRFWLDEEKKLCRMYGKERETMKHIFEKCKITGKEGI